VITTYHIETNVIRLSTIKSRIIKHMISIAPKYKAPNTMTLSLLVPQVALTHSIILRQMPHNRVITKLNRVRGIEEHKCLLLDQDPTHLRLINRNRLANMESPQLLPLINSLVSLPLYHILVTGNMMHIMEISVENPIWNNDEVVIHQDLSLDQMFRIIQLPLEFQMNSWTRCWKRRSYQYGNLRII
jgi:hypothetical protein